VAQVTTLNKIQQGKQIIDNEKQIKLKNIINPTLLQVSKVAIKYKIIKENKYSKKDGHPIIFAVNHYSAQDTPIICNSINERGYILAGKQNLAFIDEIFFNLYGSIFVDRKDKEDMIASKKAMEEYLKKNQSIIMFPEGTWNLSDELLMLPMKWGIIDVAQETDAQIIPVNLDYNRETKECRVTFGEPILPDNYRTKKEQIDELRDIMATMRWKSMEKQPIVKRTDLDKEKARAELKQVLKEYPLLDAEYENSIIFKPNPTPEEVFESIKNLEIRKENAFLFHKNNKGIR